MGAPLEDSSVAEQLLIIVSGLLRRNIFVVSKNSILNTFYPVKTGIFRLDSEINYPQSYLRLS